jgi:hypothetical protein
VLLKAFSDRWPSDPISDVFMREMGAKEIWTMAVENAQKRIVMEVAEWEGVVASPHRFGGTEFTLGKRELGHIHEDYQADIVFPMAVRNRLITEGRAEPRHILPRQKP